jgi:hypothetical protein
MRWIAALGLIGCAGVDDGVSRSGPVDGQLPPPGAPTLRISEVVSGASTWVEFGDGTPGWTGLFWRGAPGTSCPPYLNGQCLGIGRPVVTRVGALSATGAATWSVGIPAGLPPGVGTRLQGAMHNTVDVVLTPPIDVQVGTGAVCGGSPSAVSNPGFEETATGTWALPAGWGWAPDFSEGTQAIAVTGNSYAEQWFPAVPVRSLTRASFDSWHDGLDAPLMAVEWTYSDGTTGSTAYQAPELDGWQTHDLRPLLTTGKSLVHLRVWGYASQPPAPDVTHFDAFAFCR